MSISEAARAISSVFPDQTIKTPQGTQQSLRVVMLAIAGVETGWNVSAPGDPLGSCSTCVPPDCRGYTSYGYFQVHFYDWHAYLTQATGSTDPCTWASWLSVPIHSAQAAWALYQAAEKEFGNGLQPWWPDVAGSYAAFPHVTASHPPYLAHIAAAQTALAAVTSAPGITGSTVGSVQKKTPPRSVLSVITPSPPVALAAVLVAGGLTIAAWETDANWGSIREWFGRPRGRGTMNTKGD